MDESTSDYIEDTCHEENDKTSKELDDDISFINTVPFDTSTPAVEIISETPKKKISDILCEDGCEHLFSEQDIQNCMKINIKHEYSSFDLCKMFLSAFFHAYLKTSFVETDGISNNSIVQQKSFFLKKYIQPLRHKVWPFAFKLFLFNQVAFTEKRLRNINELVDDESHYGLRALLLCRNRLQSQSFIQSYRDWLDNTVEEMKNRLRIPDGLCEQLIQTSIEHTVHQNVHKTLKKRSPNYQLEPCNNYDGWAGKKKQKLVELLHSLADELDD